MLDLSLNENFSVHLDDRNDLATVDGNAAFEQAVVVMLTDFMHEELSGLTGSEAVEEKIRLQVSRVARENGAINSVAAIEVEEDPEAPGTFTVEIVYIAGQTFEFELES